MKGSHILWTALIVSAWLIISYVVIQPTWPSWFNTNESDWAGTQVAWFVCSWGVLEIIAMFSRLIKEPNIPWHYFLNFSGLIAKLGTWIPLGYNKLNAWADKNIGV